MEDCEFAILGAGAIGSIVGGHLARAGHSVLMLARGARAEQLRTHGISVRGLSEFTLPVRTLTDPRQLRAARTLIVATKTPGTRAALEPLAAARIERVLSLQNGLVKDEMLARAACKVDQLWVASCTAARRASSTWLRRCPTVCWAARVCE